MVPYACPSCKNRTRFYFVEQNPVPVKLDPQTGEVTETVQFDDPLLLPYRGEMLRLQCGVCGTMENETAFAKTAQRLM